MGLWGRRARRTVLLPSIVEENSREHLNELLEGEVGITETTSLLNNNSSSSSRPHSTHIQSSSSNPPTKSRKVLCCGCHVRQQLLVTTTLLLLIATAAAILIFCIVSLVSSKNKSNSSNNRNDLLSNPMGLSRPAVTTLALPVLDNNVTTTTFTFRALARALLPGAYQEMLPLLTTILSNRSILPENVSQTRKALLKTRDLLDIFGPVYPNNHNHENKQDKEDTWLALRSYLDDGYTAIGEFLDLVHSHVHYSPKRLNTRRNQVLDWNRAFEAKFRHDHHSNHHDDQHMLAFLTHATVHGSVRHEKESRFFWNSLDKEEQPQQQQQQQQQRVNPPQPRGDDPAIQSLQWLVSKQLDLALYYFRLAEEAYPVPSTTTTINTVVILNATEHNATLLLQNLADLNKEDSFHEHYHNCRKALRAVTDEFDLFGSSYLLLLLEDDTDTTIDPSNSNNKCSKTDALGAIAVLQIARGLLGALNDDWTAYSIYVMEGSSSNHNNINDNIAVASFAFPEEQTRLAEKINLGWANFKNWTIQENFPGAVSYLSTVCMQPS
jgi:hypothetical protein